MVGYNVARGRRLRGLTQTELGQRLADLTGTPWSRATVSVAEKSWDGDSGRSRHFDADELAAFAIALDLPIAWFFLPPPAGPNGEHVRRVAWLTPRKTDAGPEHSITSDDLVRLLAEVDPDLITQRMREDGHNENDEDEWGSALEHYGSRAREGESFRLRAARTRLLAAADAVTQALQALGEPDEPDDAPADSKPAGPAVAAGQAGPGHPMVTEIEQYDEGKR